MQGQGPGHRAQRLALSPEEELELGREAFREILVRARDRILPEDDPRTEQVERIGERIVEASRIPVLLREINLREDGYRFEWEFRVIESHRVNAFCLPAGKVVAFTGLLEVVQSEDELATVLGHEMAHALAHHASERLALSSAEASLLRAAHFQLSNLDESQRDRILSLLAPGTTLQSLSYDRFQESEADHIGVFLTTFAGYDPRAALSFWERMREISAGAIRLPEILSDHPTDARRIAQLQEWVPLALGAKGAYDRGEIAPETNR
jgi:predicted Zn-dependent protease